MTAHSGDWRVLLGQTGFSPPEYHLILYSPEGKIATVSKTGTILPSAVGLFGQIKCEIF